MKNNFFANNIFGLKVFVNPLIEPVAKVSLSKDIPCNDGFRIEYDQWLKEFFGTKEVAYESNGKLFVSPAGLEALQNGTF